jgi:hypothetical protein
MPDAISPTSFPALTDEDNNLGKLPEKGEVRVLQKRRIRVLKREG